MGKTRGAIRTNGQQGDVLVRRVDGIPAGAKRVKTTRVVLAEGESTGHAHVIEDVEAVELYEKDGNTYIRVKDATTITHEEHKHIDIAPGDYQYGKVVEIDPFTEEIRKVKD